MKRTLSVVLTLCVALVVTTLASAAPIITAVGSDVGLAPGLFAWDVFFDGNDGVNLAAGVDLKFEGDLNQTLILGSFPILDLNAAQTFAGFGAPDINDSYLYTGASPTNGLPTENGAGVATWGAALPTGIDNPNGAAGGPAGGASNGAPMWMSNGTTTLFFSEVIQVAHIVIDTTGADSLATLTVTGRLARTGPVLENLEFVFQIPEPSTFIMLGMGAFALVGAGWRRRKRA